MSSTLPSFYELHTVFFLWVPHCLLSMSSTLSSFYEFHTVFFLWVPNLLPISWLSSYFLLSRFHTSSLPTLSKQYSESPHKNRVCHDWSGSNGLCLFYVYAYKQNNTKLMNRCICSNRDRFGFYVDIRLFLGQCLKSVRLARPAASIDRVRGNGIPLQPNLPYFWLCSK